MKGGGGGPSAELGGTGALHCGCRKKPSAVCLFVTQLVRILRACLLMFSASPATAAMVHGDLLRVCGGRRRIHTYIHRKGARRDAAPYTVRSVLVAAAKQK